ncbi:MAG: ResB protein required for cytochrome C biosynthesis [Verrucomicrobia bacterium]|nr:MAG: ResB protein required for cytochrome C biosynthesis [Verrucomicrobiota bacterium]
MHKIGSFFSSLKLTIILLACAMVLIFFGTLDQVDYGIYEVQKRYFASFFTIWHYPLQWPGSNFLSWIILPLPGGYLLTTLLVINLLAAHFRYFVLRWSKIGIAFIHLGILMLIISGVISSLLQSESQMMLTQDKPVSYSQVTRENELVIIDTTDPNQLQTHTISEKTLRSSSIIPISNTPLSIKLEKFYPNSDIGLRSQNPEVKEKSLATQGAGVKMDIVVFPKPVSYKEDEANGVTAYVTVLGRDEETQSLDDIGTWLVSTIIDERFPAQKFSFAHKSYEIALRPKRIYFPFSLKLLKFNHDLYPGTDIPRNFSSLVEIINPAKVANRTVLIYMNNPLRYEGYTFYQASYAGKNSVLQVVKNPGWLLPYFSVLLVALGLTFHFFLYLFKYLTKTHQHSSIPQN